MGIHRDHNGIMPKEDGDYLDVARRTYVARSMQTSHKPLFHPAEGGVPRRFPSHKSLPSQGAC